MGDVSILIAIANREIRLNQLGQVKVASFWPRPFQGKYDHVTMYSFCLT